MSTIEITQKSFLLRYGISLALFLELLIIFTIVVSYLTMGASIPTLVMLLLSPLLGNVIAGKRLKKYKKVVFTENLNKYFIIINVLLYIGIYLLNLKLDITLIVIYSMGAIIGFFIAKKFVDKIKIDMQKEYGEDD